MSKKNKDYIPIKYKEGCILFYKKSNGTFYGEYEDDFEEFFVYKKDGVYLLDYVIQGIYIGSLIGKTSFRVLNMLKKTGWEYDLEDMSK